MFCYQCEQTSQGKGCIQIGVCGKEETSADLQDLLVYAVQGISMYAHRARGLGAADPEVDGFVLEALFATLTNVNFDAHRLELLVRRAATVRDAARRIYVDACAAAGRSPETLGGPAAWEPACDTDGLLAQSRINFIPERVQLAGQEITNLKELVQYGLKGAAAYAEHARQLGATDAGIYATLHELLDFLTQPITSAEEMLGAALRTGELNLRIMELLDGANTGAFGHPEPTQVPIFPRKGKAILVSGHDLADLGELLKQTEGLGIQVYTHGEMLPAHGYPKLRAWSQLAGNYGGPWMDQYAEFAAFPGAILMTSNCIQKPAESYKDRLFTCGPTAWPGVRHLENRDFAPLIAAALEAPGFGEDGPADTIPVGFGHNAVLSAAGTVVEAVKSGAIRHFFLIGGCDGARAGRNYYTDIAQQVPEDCMILTLGCGKFRFNKLEFGNIGPFPRMLDLGQCNDSYSAIKIASALAGAFDCGVNDLPLSLVISWYEQKAIAVLLTLLHLGIRGIRIGPTLPAFLSPAVLGLLKEKYNLRATTTAEQDLAEVLG